MAWTNMTNGTLPDADEVMDNFAEIIHHRKIISSAGEETHTGDTNWTDTSCTATLTGMLNAMVLGVTITAEMKNSDANQTASATLKISGTNLGTKYVTMGSARHLGAASYSAFLVGSVGSLVSVTDNSYQVVVAAGSPILKCLDASTTFMVQFMTSDGTDTAYIKNMIVEIVYVNRFTED